MRRFGKLIFFGILCAVSAISAASVSAAAPEVSGGAAAFSCRENRRDCLLLQAVCAGYFDGFDPSDALEGRVYAAVFPQMCGISEDTFEHYGEEFGADEDDVRILYYGALSSCLLADILYETPSGEKTDAWMRVLLLFLNPSGESGTKEETDSAIRTIREEITGDVIEKMAERAGVDDDYIEWLIMGENSDD